MAEDSSATVRQMLAMELQVEPSSLTDDFRWLDAVPYEDELECFLMELNDRFTRIPSGLSVGSGDQPFHGELQEEFMAQIATVGGLIAYIEQHLSKQQA